MDCRYCVVESYTGDRRARKLAAAAFRRRPVPDKPRILNCMNRQQNVAGICGSFNISRHPRPIPWLSPGMPGWKNMHVFHPPIRHASMLCLAYPFLPTSYAMTEWKSTPSGFCQNFSKYSSIFKILGDVYFSDSRCILVITVRIAFSYCQKVLLKFLCIIYIWRLFVRLYVFCIVVMLRYLITSYHFSRYNNNSNSADNF